MSAELHAYLILIVIGFLPSEVWRWLGIALGRGLDEQSEIILWVRGVATALIAGVIARIVPARKATGPVEWPDSVSRMKRLGKDAARGTPASRILREIRGERF